MTLFERVTLWMIKEARKHEKFQFGVDEYEYIRNKVNAMSPCELLEAISDALEEEKP